MASIHRRGGKHSVRWRDPEGSEWWRRCPDTGSAKRLQREIEQFVAEGRRWEPRDARPRPDIDEILTAYTRHVARLRRKNTAIRIARALELFRRYLRVREGGRAKLHVDLLTRSLLDDFYEYLCKTGLHGRPRKPQTAGKIVQIIQRAWAWAHNQDEYVEDVPVPKTLELPPAAPRPPTVAPSWAEMDACIAACSGWHRNLAIVLRFTGLRVQQAMSLRWTDLDLERGYLTVRGELGKTTQEQHGRIMPLSEHLVAALATWPRDPEGWVIASNRTRGGERERMARARDMGRAWRRAGVRPEACQQPHHAFRKGFTSGLRKALVDPDAIEVLVGHSLGLRGVYTDHDALGLHKAVARIPAMVVPVAPENVVHFHDDRQARLARGG